MVLQNVSLADISTNNGGICNGGFTTRHEERGRPEQRRQLPERGPAVRPQGDHVVPRDGQPRARPGLPVEGALLGQPREEPPGAVRLPDRQGAVVERPEPDRDPLDLLRLPQGRSDPSGRRDLRRHPALQHGRQPLVRRDGRHPRRRLVSGRDLQQRLLADGHPLHHHRPEALHQGPLDRRHEDARDAGLADGPDPQEPEPELPQEAGTDRAAPAPPGPRGVPLPGRHGLRVPHLVEHELPA